MEKEVANALSTNYPVQHSNAGTTKWHKKMSECVVAIPAIDSATDEQLGALLLDGAEFGQFCKVGNTNALGLTLHAGALQSGYIVMEIQGCRIPGMTHRDALSWLRSQGKHGHPVMIKMVLSALLPDSLGEFLQRKYARDSPDAALQQSIRDNVYARTAACTTRARKPNEQHGVDYWFVSTAYFSELRSAGALLECGQFDGNCFGTPVPPMEEDAVLCRAADANGVTLPLSEDHMRLLRLRAAGSKRSQTDLGVNDERGGVSRTQPYGEPVTRTSLLRSLEHDPLPPNWDVQFDEQDRAFFVDRSNGATQWLDPRLARTMKSDPLECADDELPYGWQRIDDAQYGTYFVDHLNRRTQYENPVQEAKRRLRETRSASSIDSATASSSPNRSSFNDTRSIGAPLMQNATARGDSPSPSEYATRLHALQTGAAPFRNSLFAPELDVRAYANKPAENTPPIDLVTITIVKGLAGFGFKLSCKADGRQRVKEVTDPRRCGQLRVGDVLFALDRRDVRRVPHADLVALLQGYSVNTSVTFVVERERERRPDMQTPQRIAESAAGRKGPPYAPFATKPNLLPANGTRLVHAKSTQDLRNGNERPQPAGPLAVRGELQPVAYALPPASDRPLAPTGPPRMRGADQFSGSLSHGLDTVGVTRGASDWTDAPLTHRPELRMSHSALNRITNIDSSRSPPPSGTGSSSATSPDLLNTTPDFIPASVLLKRSPGGAQRAAAPLAASQANLARMGAANLSKSFMNLNAPTASEHVQLQPSVTASQLSTTQGAGAGARHSLTSSSSAAGSIGMPANRPAILAGANTNSHVPASASQLNANAAAFGHQTGRQVANDSEVVQLELGWSDVGYGFKIIGGSELSAPVSVGFLEPSLAADGRLRIGDELLTVNDASIVNASCANVVKLIGSTYAQRQSLRLNVRRSRLAKPGPAPASLYSSGQHRLDNTPPNRSASSSRPPSTSTTQSITSGYASQPSSTSGPTAPSVVSSNAYSPNDVAHFMLQRRTPNESFGFVMVTNVQKRIVTVARVQADSPASRCGLQPGDRILFVNGTDVNSMPHDAIVAMIKQAGPTIRLAVLPVATLANSCGPGQQSASATVLLAGQRDSLSASVDSDVSSSSPSAVSSNNANSANMGQRYALSSSSSYNVIAGAIPNDSSALRPSNNLENVVPPHPAMRRFVNANVNSGSAGAGPTLTVQLKRGARGFGFSVKGGYEFSAMPLQIFQIAKGGAADLDTRLQAGDEVLQINEHRTHNMTQKNAIELIQQCGPVILLVVRRNSSS